MCLNDLSSRLFLNCSSLRFAEHVDPYPSNKRRKYNLTLSPKTHALMRRFLEYQSPLGGDE